jgi:hypothetical protein
MKIARTKTVTERQQPQDACNLMLSSGLILMGSASIIIDGNPPMTTEHDSIKTIVDGISALSKQAAALLVGKRVRIISKYNGQQYGSSRKPLTGHEANVCSVSIDRFGCHVWLEGLHYGYPALELREVEFVDNGDDN